jgi:mannose PTS system EIID component
MAIIPAIREWNINRKDVEGLLTRHLQMFNTHPYFSAAVVGSVIRLEEEQIKGTGAKSSVADVVAIKQILSGPYAAIGDIFFWGAIRPFAAIVSCVLAYMGYVIAPLAFLFLYTPAHIWVRLKGFLEGYRRGKQGIDFIRILDLPRIAVNIRWLSLMVLACWAAFLLGSEESLPVINLPGIVMKLVAMSTILFCIGLIKKRISQFYILYGAVLFFLLISWKEF